MRRIRNSVKAIIVSLCLVVVLAGSIIGVVLVNKNKGKDPGKPTNPVDPATKYELTDDQIKLLSGVGGVTSGANLIATEFDASRYVDENGDEIDLTKVSNVTTNEFKYRDDLGSTYYVLKNDGGKTYYEDVFDYLNIQGTIVLRQCLDFKNGHASYFVLNNLNGKNNINLIVYDLKAEKILKSYVLEDVGDDYTSNPLLQKTGLFMSNDLYYFITPTTIENVVYSKVEVFSFNESVEPISFVINRNTEEDAYFYDKHFLIVGEEKTVVGYLNGDEIVSREYEFENYYQPYFCQNLVFAEHATAVDNSVNYSYSVIDMLSGQIKNFDLQSGYCRAYFNSEISDFYGVFEQKPAGNGKYTYYDYSGNKVIVYDAASEDDKIIAYSGANILTSKGILTTQKSVDAEFVVEFDSESFDYELSSIDTFGVNENTFVLKNKDSTKYAIMDMSGKFVFNTEFVSLYSYDDGYYYAYDGASHYILNVATRTISEIENYSSLNIFLEHGGGIYLTVSEGVYTLHDYKGAQIDLNAVVDDCEYEHVGSRTKMNLVSNSQVVASYMVDKYISLPEQEEEIPESDPYGVELYKTTVPNSGTVDNDIEYTYSYTKSGSWTMVVTLPSGYMLGSSSFQIDRNNATDADPIPVNCSHYSATTDAGKGTCSGITAEYSESSKRYKYTIKGTSDTYWLFGTQGYGDELNSVNFTKVKITMEIKYSNMDNKDDFRSESYHDATFDGNHPTSATYGDVDIQIDGASRPGFTFTGWKLNSSNDGYSFVSVGDDGKYDFSPTKVGTSVTLAASWEANTYQITFYKDSTKSEMLTDRPVTEYTCGNYQYIDLADETHPLPSNPGYSFSTWVIDVNTNSNFAGSVSDITTDGQLHIPTGCYGDIVLYADWTKNEYTFRFVFGEVVDDDSANVLMLSDFNTSTYVYTGNYNNSVQTYGKLYTQFHATYDMSGYCTTETSKPAGWDDLSWIEKKFFVDEPQKPFDTEVLITSHTSLGGYEISIDGDETNEVRTKISNANKDYYKFYYPNLDYFMSPLDVKPFAFEYSSDISLSTKLYRLVDDYPQFKYFNPNESEFAFSVFNVPYQIKGWAVKTSNETNDFQLLSDQTIDIITYLENLGKSTDEDAVIDLYAVYVPKEYDIYVETDIDYGRGALDVYSSNVHEINNEHLEVNYTIQQDTGSDENKFVSPGIDSVLTLSAFNLYASDRPVFKLLIDNPNNRYPYSFDRIEISNFGYKTDDGYAYAKIVLKNDNGFLNMSVVDSSGNNLIVDKLVPIGYSDEYYFIRTGSEPTSEFINGIRYDQPQFEGTSNEDSYVYLYFYNLGYSGDKTTKEISEESVKGGGTYGFTIKSYFRVNYTDNDSVSKNSDSAAGEFLSTNVTPVYKEENVVRSDSALGITDFNYFWLNGYRFTLVDSSGATFNTSGAMSGYYELLIDSGEYVPHQPIEEGVEYRLDNVKFVSFKAKLISAPVTDKLSTFGISGERRIVYFENFGSAVNIYNDDGSAVKYIQTGNIYYMGGGDAWADEDYNVSIENQTLNYTNYNSTQFIAITPSQTHINLSSNPTTTSTSSWYELETYLSQIIIRGTTFNFSINKVLNKDSNREYYLPYSDIIEVDGGNVEKINSDRVIDYVGNKYVTKQAYTLTVQIGSGSSEQFRTFAIFFAIRETDNHVMYFIYSNVGDFEAFPIEIKFSEVAKTITTTISDAEKYGENAGTDGDGVGATATVEYYNQNYNADKRIDHVKLTEANAATSSAQLKKIVRVGDNFRTTTYTETINSDDLRLIKISPTDGFIIQSINVKLGDKLLMSFTLNTIDVETDYANKYHSFVTTDSAGSAISSYLLKYNYNLTNEYFESVKFDSNYSGILYSVTENTSWRTDASIVPAFETIYLLVGGIYQNVQIDVETASYIEFNFEDDSNVLEASQANNRYELVSNGYQKSDVGAFLLNVTDVSSFVDSRTKYSYNGSSYVEDANGLYIQYDGSIYKKLYQLDGTNFVESSSGTYIIEEVSISSYYGYTTKAGSKYYLQNVKNLSILVKNENEWIKLGVNYGLYDASLVKKDSDYLRVIFIGKKSIFANGVAIFASGENYSAYFTSGYMYNDDGNDAKGLYSRDNSDAGLSSGEGNGSYTAFQFLSDIEGRHEDTEVSIEYKASASSEVETKNEIMNPYTPLDKTRENHLAFGDYYTDNTLISKYLTYMQIDDLDTFFKYTDTDRQGIRFEFARKYYFSVTVAKNEVTMNVNSFISNGNLGTFQEEGNRGEAGYQTAEQVKNAAIEGYYADEAGNNDKNIAQSILASGTKITLKTDNRNKFDAVSYVGSNKVGFAYTVVNGISNFQLGNTKGGYKQAAPYMWIGESNVYQLDYVNTTAGREYNKAQSWFNDTVLTNIDYTYYNQNNAENYVSTNWQDIKKYYQDENKDPNHTISGYGISYTYNAIPGYYLEYIILETVEFGILYIPVSSVDSVSSKVSDTKYVLSGQLVVSDGNTSTDDNKRIHYYVDHIIDKINNIYSYTLRLYEEGQDVNNVTNMHSLGIISNNITVSFFSKAYNIKVNYDLNNASDEISSKETATVSGAQKETGKTTYIQEGLVYDSLGTLSAIASMTGYTFVGWGSEKTGSNADDYRFVEESLKWKSTSSWLPVTGRNYGSLQNINYFDDDYRSELINLCQNNHGYDFYIKSSDKSAETGRANTTGYFITDSGYAEGVSQENYNFWSTYANIFFKYSMQTTSHEAYVVNLYAVWKANVYSTEFYLNDADAKYGSNGSSYSSMSFRSNSDLNWNSTTKNTTTYGVSLGSGILANLITYSEKNGNATESAVKYYCYVTFDKNDWYLINAEGILEGYSNQITKTGDIIKFTDSVNQLNYVIDRYGYSWLGWFSKDFNNAYESKQLADDSGDRLVFGSDYYYAKIGRDSSSRPMPYLRYDTYSSSNMFVKIGDFTRSYEEVANGTEVVQKEIYSEFVYKGEKYFNDLYLSDRNNYKYVYHYDYKTNINNETTNRNYYENNIDYLNAGNINKTYNQVENGVALVYFDTSIKLSAYVIDGTEVKIQRVKANSETGDVLNYRFIVLYSYWLTNNYKVVIDYRDENSTSINNLGSTNVTNKEEIEATDKDEFDDANDLSGTSQKSINSTYFDDDFFSYILNMSIPTRIGYDFLGWSFFFRDPSIYSGVQDTAAANGDLYKYNGLTYANTVYTLNNGSINANYYYRNEQNNNVEYKNIFALYTSAGLDMIDGNNYVALSNNLEAYGDEEYGAGESDGNHYIYIFALWRAQTFTINVGLNIDAEDLTNSYDKDSSYSIAFYEDENASNSASNTISSPTGYTGINSLFLKQKRESQNMDTYSDIYAEVVSNLTFVITFDELFTTARFVDPNASETKYYYLKDLFAVSAGYYFVGWLYNANDVNSKLIANTLKTEFGYNYAVQNNESIGEQAILPDYFNIEWYDKLYNSNYKNMTGADYSPEDSYKEFLDGNNNKLNELDGSGKSSNFGYITIAGKQYYIMTEYNDSNNDYITNTHRLFFRYNGKKYYVAFYNKEGDSNIVLSNDFNYLYYPMQNGNNKYVIRFDSDGVAYYLTNTIYDNRKQLLSLNIAIFEHAEFFDNAGTNIGNSNNKKNDVSSVMRNATFSMTTTRQFTLYADWQIKDDFVISFRNGNSGVHDGADYTRSNTSNPGLAGFSSLYNYGDYTNSILQTETIYDVGGGNVCYGEDIDGTDRNFTFYQGFGFDLIPYFNGRFINKLNINFDRIESTAESGISDSPYVTNTYSKVEYSLQFSFKWDNENHTPTITGIELYKYGPNRDPNTGELIQELLIQCTVETFTNAEGLSIIQITETNETGGVNSKATALRSYLSVIDTDSFKSVTNGGIARDGLFKMSAYGTSTGRNYGYSSTENLSYLYGRRDVNMLSFDMNDLMSSVRVSFKYAIQTYQLDVHHIFDEKGDTLTQVAGNNSLYVSEITDINATGLYNQQNSLISSSVYSDLTPSGANHKLATIPINLDGGGYNVPYGYFVYGDHYDSELVGFRPMDDYYADESRTNDFDGFNYIYVDGNYSKGASTLSDAILNNNGTDTYYDQGSPILGSASTFPDRSIRLSRSFYLFKGFYEYAGKTGTYVQFDLYNEDDEGSFINRNITLYGYYFSNNTPTNIQFYTWNNDWNENSPAYLPYNNNAEEYTLSSSEEGSAYQYNDGYLKPDSSLKDIEGARFVDSEGRVIFASRIEYGIDFAGFNNIDQFSTYELPKTEIGILETITKTYWYYEEIYNLLSANIEGIGNVYIKYDKQVESEYIYVPEISSVFKEYGDYKSEYDGMIVNKEEYQRYLSDGANYPYTSVTILGWVDISQSDTDSDGTPENTSKIIYKDQSTEINLYESGEESEYYFYNETANLYYYFKVTSGELTNVRSQVTDEIDAFYYEYLDESDNTIIQKVKVNVSQDMSSANILEWSSSENEGKGGYPEISASNLIPLIIEKVYVYGKRFIGAELYAAQGDGDNAKYYKYHRVDDTMLTTEWLASYKPRYYVDIQGVRYYTFITIKAENSATTYNFNDLYTKDGEMPSVTIAKTLTTLNNYFVILDEKYHEIQFKQIEDNRLVFTNNGSNYVVTDYIYVPSLKQIVNSTDYSQVIAHIDLQSSEGPTIILNGSASTQPLNYDSANELYYFTYSGTTYYLGAVNSVYVNPALNESTVELEYEENTKTYYFDYSNNSKTSGLYETYLNGAYSDAVLFDYSIYTPINLNYSIHPVDNGTSWVTSDTTINTFPSLNMDYWYSNPEYVLLGYLDVREEDIAAMKRSDEGEASESIYKFITSLNQIVIASEYGEDGNGGAYSVFATVDFANMIVSLASGSVLILNQGDEANEYYFSYEDAYYYFVSTEDNMVIIDYQKEGGQIIAAFTNYINTTFPDIDTKPILTAISAKITDFKIDDLVKYPMYVENYTLSTSDFKTIKSADVRVTTQFVLTMENINAVAGLLELCKTVEGLAIKSTLPGGDVVYEIIVSTTFVYTFDIITTNTLIDSNIYAIPAYVPDVIKFVDCSGRGYDDDDNPTYSLTGSISSIDGDALFIDYKKMKITHFDLATFRMYNSDYIWDPDDIKMYPEDYGDRQDLIDAADYLQFVVLTAAQYRLLVESEIGDDAKLNSMITGNDLRTSNDLLVRSLSEITDADIIFQDNEDNTKDIISQKIALDMSDWTGDENYSGDLYILAFYYGMGTFNATTQYVFTYKNENATQTYVMTWNDLVDAYSQSLSAEELASFDRSTVTEEQLISYAESATIEGVPQFGKLTEIRYNKHINRVSDNVLHVVLENGQIQGCPEVLAI